MPLFIAGAYSTLIVSILEDQQRRLVPAKPRKPNFSATSLVVAVSLLRHFQRRQPSSFLTPQSVVPHLEPVSMMRQIDIPALSGLARYAPDDRNRLLSRQHAFAVRRPLFPETLRPFRMRLKNRQLPRSLAFGPVTRILSCMAAIDI